MPNLTPEQARFKDWLQHPLLQRYTVYWDFSCKEVDLKMSQWPWIVCHTVKL